jgi:hypothetical protein
MPNKLKVLCKVDWPDFGVGWPPEGSLDKTVINYGNSQDAPPLMNGLRKCGIYTQWNFMQP